MRTAEELISREEHAWSLVQESLQRGGGQVVIRAASVARGQRALAHLQVSTRSPLGAVALEADHIVIDHGWLRILGAGSKGVWGLVEWNPEPEDAGFLIVAHDVLGGLFALNGGALPGETGKVVYFAPDALRWEPCGLGFSEFLSWVATERVGQFYGGQRWVGWEVECSRLEPDQGLSVYPFLWAEGPSIGERSRRRVPMAELWSVAQEVKGKMGL